MEATDHVFDPAAGDGLAGGCMAIVTFVFLVLALLGGIPQLGRFLLLPTVPTSDQMSVRRSAVFSPSCGEQPVSSV